MANPLLDMERRIARLETQNAVRILVGRVIPYGSDKDQDGRVSYVEPVARQQLNLVDVAVRTGRPVHDDEGEPTDVPEVIIYRNVAVASNYLNPNVRDTKWIPIGSYVAFIVTDDAGSPSYMISMVPTEIEAFLYTGIDGDTRLVNAAGYPDDYKDITRGFKNLIGRQTGAVGDAVFTDRASATERPTGGADESNTEGSRQMLLWNHARSITRTRFISEIFDRVSTFLPFGGQGATTYTADRTMLYQRDLGAESRGNEGYEITDRNEAVAGDGTTRSSIVKQYFDFIVARVKAAHMTTSGADEPTSSELIVQETEARIAHFESGETDDLHSRVVVGSTGVSTSVADGLGTTEDPVVQSSGVAVNTQEISIIVNDDDAEKAASITLDGDTVVVSFSDGSARQGTQIRMSNNQLVLLASDAGVGKRSHLTITPTAITQVQNQNIPSS